MHIVLEKRSAQHVRSAQLQQLWKLALYHEDLIVYFRAIAHEKRGFLFYFMHQTFLHILILPYGNPNTYSINMRIFMNDTRSISFLLLIREAIFVVFNKYFKLFKMSSIFYKILTIAYCGFEAIPGLVFPTLSIA